MGEAAEIGCRRGGRSSQPGLCATPRLIGVGPVEEMSTWRAAKFICQASSLEGTEPGNPPCVSASGRRTLLLLCESPQVVYVLRM